MRKSTRQPACRCKLSCLGNVYLDIKCHTFLGCCCSSLCTRRMVPLWVRVQHSEHLPGLSVSLSNKCFIISQHERDDSYLGPQKSTWWSSLWMFVSLEHTFLKDANLAFRNLMWFHLLNYEEVYFNLISLLRLPGLDLLWHTEKSVSFYRTGFYILTVT